MRLLGLTSILTLTLLTGCSNEEPPPPPSAIPNVAPCVPSEKGKDYQVGDGDGQLGSLAEVPWEDIAPGDTVRIFHRSEPYRGKILLSTAGTADRPVRVCGVKSAAGERPILDGDGAVARPAPATGTLYTGSASNENIQETRSIVMIDRLSTQDYESAIPAHIQIDGLEIRGATPEHSFTNSLGNVQSYEEFGACIWLHRGNHIFFADNVLHDCSQAIFSRSSDEGFEAALTRDLRLSGNYMYDTGKVGSDKLHTTYIQTIGTIYEFNHYGLQRPGAVGSALKDRSVGAIVRFNRIEGGAHAIDLVDAEDYPEAAQADPAYATAYVYGNKISRSAQEGSMLHYGGDSYMENVYRKGTVYFFSNTVYVSGGTSGTTYLFQLSTTDEHAEVWNNVFAFAPDPAGQSRWFPSFRASQDGSEGVTSGGIMNLGVNWTNIVCTADNTSCPDTDSDHPTAGELNGVENLVFGKSLAIDPTTLHPISGSGFDGAAQEAVDGAKNYAVDYQLTTELKPEARASARDLGAYGK